MPPRRSDRIKGKAAFALPFFLSALAPAPALAAAHEERLPPFSSWQVVKHENSCVLRRAFGSAHEPLLVQLERFTPADGFRMTLAGPYLGGWQSGEKLTVRYEPGQGADEFPRFRADTLRDGKPTIALYSSLAGRTEKTEWTKVTPAIEAAVTSIALIYRNESVVLETGSLAEPFAAFRTCSDQLQPEPVATSSQGLARVVKPLGNPGNWVTTADYPRGALSVSLQAEVNFRLAVGIDGKPTGCTILDAYSAPQFKEVSCALLMSRARFTPALDAEGKPATSTYRSRIRWTVP